MVEDLSVMAHPSFSGDYLVIVFKHNSRADLEGTKGETPKNIVFRDKPFRAVLIPLGPSYFREKMTQSGCISDDN